MTDEHAQTTGGDARDLRIGRILNDYLDRRARGAACSPADLLAQHPDLADELRQHLGLLTDLRPTAEKLDALITQGLLTKSADPDYPAELGPYKILGIIGRGGMGIVLKAYDEPLNRTVALKILRPELAEDAGVLKRFEREAQAAAALRHPNIVTVYAVGQHRGVHYIAMEYVPGPSLSMLIRGQGTEALRYRGTEAHRHKGTKGVETAGPRIPSRSDDVAESLPRPLPTELIRDIFRQLLTGLAAAHEAGLIHRDVKSANILLEEGFEDSRIRGSEQNVAAAPSCLDALVPCCLSVKLADFGLARMRSSQTQLTLPDSVLGTPEYMSPEQARGEREIDHRTDLYSAGVVLYETLTGRTPFQAETPTATIHRILHDEPEHPRKLRAHADPVLASLALRLLAKRAADRLPSASEAMRILDSNRRVGQPIRKLLRRLITLLAAALVCVAVWFGLPLVTATGPISEVRIDPESQHIVQVQYGNSTKWKKFYEFPPGFTNTLAACEFVQDVDARQIVVVGLNQELDEHGNVLVAFDCNVDEVWRIALDTDYARQKWPDCSEEPGKLTKWWSVKCIAKGTLGRNQEEEELIVAAQHPELYPTRISIVSPTDGSIRSSFWHFGHIETLWVEDDYFGGRSAIYATGYNNKLDGFDDGLRPGERQYAHWDVVPVMMVLDPMDMDGLGPPHTERLPDMKRAMPWAYACLDLQFTSGVDYVASAQPRQCGEPSLEQLEHSGYIRMIKQSPRISLQDKYPLFSVMIDARPSEGDQNSRGTIVVDRNLGVHSASELKKPNDGVWFNEKYWREHWRPIIQQGEYIDEQ